MRIAARLAVLLALVAAPAAAAAVELAVSPASMELERGSSPVVRLTLDGVEERGGVFDLFASSGSAVVEFPAEQQRQGIVLLPGASVAMEWTPRVRTLRGLDDGAHDVVFRLVERPGPPQPRVLEAVLTFELASVGTTTDPPLPQPPPSESGREHARWVGLGALALGGALALRRAVPPLVALYWRTRRDRLLEHPVRAAMVEAVRDEPGITPAELQRRLGIADGQLDHHLRRLVQSGSVQKVAADGARRLYLAGAAPPGVVPLADRIRDALRDGDASAREVAARVGVSPQHARYYLEKMRSEGAVRVRADRMRRVYGLA